MIVDAPKSALFLALFGAALGAASAGDDAFDAELLALQTEWAAAKYEAADKKSRKAAFETLMQHASALAERYPNEVEAVAWEGIVLSTYAGEAGAMSAMKYAKAARETLLRAEEMDATALDGGIYASLGALYSKVPGGIVGFGDDRVAEDYFEKALAVDSGNIDTNFFYGEFLLEHGEHGEALELLNRALRAPEVESRPVFDKGRRAEIRSLIAEASKESES